MNNPDKGPTDKTKYQMPKAEPFQFHMLSFSPYKSMYDNDLLGGAIFIPEP